MFSPFNSGASHTVSSTVTRALMSIHLFVQQQQSQQSQAKIKKAKIRLFRLFKPAFPLSEQHMFEKQGQHNPHN